MRRLLLVLALVASMVGAAALQPAHAAPPARGETQLATRSVTDPTRSANGDSESVDITPDGKYMVFASTAVDLASEPPATGLSQVYLRDTATGSVRMISTKADGTRGGDGWSGSPSVSDDGRTIAYRSRASDVAPGATGGSAQVLVWSRDTGASVLVSVDGSGTPADRPVDDVDLSGDGRVVAFSTYATNLASIPTYNKSQVYRRDLAARSMSVISLSDTGNAAAGGALQPSVSRDGSSVAFTATELELDGSISAHLQVYRFLQGFPEVWLVSSVAGGRSVGGDGDSQSPSISADGESVAYSSVATNLSFEPTRGFDQIYFRVMTWSYSTLVSSPAHRGGAANSVNIQPSLSADGSHVAFVSNASNLVPDSDGTTQVFVADVSQQSMRRLSRSLDDSPADQPALSPSISGDGGLVAFQSKATNLAAGSRGMQVFLASGRARAGVERIGGVDRYAVSAAVSRETFPPGAPVAYVASGQGFADALPGSAVAGAESGPVLLVTKDGVPDAVAEELRRLKPLKIVVLGGLSTISAAVETALGSFGVPVTRVAGVDRYAGAVQLSATTHTDGTIHIGQNVYVAAGENFPDALAAAAAAGAYSAPVLLTQRDSVSAEVIAEIRRLGTAEIFVLGGPNSVSDAVVTQLSEVRATTQVAGPDRYGTAAAVAGVFTETGRTVYIASGETYPDALSGGAAAVQSGSPVLLVTRDGIPEATAGELRRLQPEHIIVLGGPNTVSDGVVNALGAYVVG